MERLNVIMPDRMRINVDFVGTTDPIVVVVGDTWADDPQDPSRHFQTGSDGRITLDPTTISDFPEGSTKYLTAIMYRDGNEIPVAQGVLIKPEINVSYYPPSIGGIGFMAIGSTFEVA